MVNPIIVAFNGADSSFDHTKVDRTRLYGARKRVPIDTADSPYLVDTYFSQILERCLVDEATGATRETQLPASIILRREAWTKGTKGKVAENIKKDWEKVA